MIKRFWTIFIARNKEFFRDRASFGWNLIFPFILIGGFSFIFQNEANPTYKFGLIHDPQIKGVSSNHTFSSFETLPMIESIPFDHQEDAFDRLQHHKIDIVVNVDATPFQYWINQSSPNGKIAEIIFLNHLVNPTEFQNMATKNTVQGREIRYVDWVFPGIISMNLMFSSLFGVGFVIVRYRKNGVLKRFKATPLSPFEYITAQIFSRLFVLLFNLSCIMALCFWLFDLHCVGRYLDFILFYILGCFCIISLGFLLAARTCSEEFANGIINLITWPIMLLSEIWFSLEGAPQWIKTLALCFPLSHVTDGLRRIFNEGDGLLDLPFQIGMLFMMTLVFLSLGVFLFKWGED